MADSSTGSTSSGSDPNRRNFLKIGAGVVGGLVVGAGIGYLAKGTSTTTTTSTSTSTETMSVTGPTTTATTTSTVTGPTTTQTATTTATSTVACTNLVTQKTALLVLNPAEALEVEAIAEAMVPSDSNGPGCKEAGCIYFIDSQLAGGNYGYNAKFYMQGPFVQANLTTPVTAKARCGKTVTYCGGTPTECLGQPYRYQYWFNMRQFWETGLAAFEAYCNTAYGANFETLSAANQASAIADCWASKPTNFTAPTAIEFISEVQEMVWAGFVTDPVHGGNKNMVGWTYTAYNGQNEGNFYGCGYTTKQLMVMCTPVVLKPASLGQLEASESISY